MVDPQNSSISARTLTWQGSKLSRKEAAKLVEKIKRDPLDMTARTKLLGYYYRALLSGLFSIIFGVKKKDQSDYLDLIKWIIENHPGSEEAGLMEMRPPPVDKELSQNIGDLWLRKIEEFPD